MKKQKKLKNNKYANLTLPQKTLDFHNKGILIKQEIIQILTQFIDECINDKTEKALIITGKGLHSKNSQPIIKPIVYSFLKTNTKIKEVISARRDRGGEGAFEIKLNKNFTKV